MGRLTQTEQSEPVLDTVHRTGFRHSTQAQLDEDNERVQGRGRRRGVRGGAQRRSALVLSEPVLGRLTQNVQSEPVLDTTVAVESGINGHLRRSQRIRRGMV